MTAEAAATRRKTEYLVLERLDPLDVERYDVIGRTEALGAVAAVKAVTAERDLPDGEITERFVAVPVSNWTAVGKSVKRVDPVVSYDVLPTIEATADGELRSVPDPEPEPEDEADEAELDRATVTA